MFENEKHILGKNSISVIRSPGHGGHALPSHPSGPPSGGCFQGALCASRWQGAQLRTSNMLLSLDRVEVPPHGHLLACPTVVVTTRRPGLQTRTGLCGAHLPAVRSRRSKRDPTVNVGDGRLWAVRPVPGQGRAGQGGPRVLGQPSPVGPRLGRVCPAKASLVVVPTFPEVFKGEARPR